MSAGSQWYLVINGAQAGPMAQEDVVSRLRTGEINRSTLVFTAGMANWTPLGEVPTLASAPAVVPGVPPPPPGSFGSTGVGQRAHDISYTVYGEDLQFVEVELDPRESAIAEAGALMYMTPGHRDGDHLRRRQRAAEDRDHGGAARRRQAAADR